MSKEEIKRAKKVEKDKTESARKRDKEEIKHAKRAEKDKAESARKRDKAERTEGDRKGKEESARRTREFDEVLSGPAKTIGCCEPCNYHVKTDNGEYRPCKMGHEDSGPGKEICADCSDPHYHPRARPWYER
jgi:hypothetical protein